MKDMTFNPLEQNGNLIAIPILLIRWSGGLN